MTEQTDAPPNVWLRQAEFTAGRLNRLAQALGLDYRTIVGSGNPQTLVWRSNAKPRQPRLDSLEAISRMT